MSKYVTLEQVLDRSTDELTAVKMGEFKSEKLGLIPYSGLNQAEYKQAKKGCLNWVKDGTGGMKPEMDDEKLKVRIIISAVDKDPRSSFTFANKELLKKLNVVTADHAVEAILSPGEIHNLAVDIQDISGFSDKAEKEDEEAVKNS